MRQLLVDVTPAGGLFFYKLGTTCALVVLEGGSSNTSKAHVYNLPASCDWFPVVPLAESFVVGPEVTGLTVFQVR